MSLAHCVQCFLRPIGMARGWETKGTALQCHTKCQMQQATQLAGESIPGFVHSLLPVELFYAILPDQLVFLRAIKCMNTYLGDRQLTEELR